MNYAEQLAISFQSQKDEIAEKAINLKIGDNWDITAINHRCAIKYVDGKEIFCLDDEELVLFLPPRFESKQSDTSYTMTAIQDYKFLNNL